MDNEPENEITITVFRLLVLDLLALFQVLNQAMINILGKKEYTSLGSPVRELTCSDRPLFRNVQGRCG